MVLIKFWLHVSSEEQERRFQERAENPLKVWKLTDEDWRNRARRKDYEQAVEEMLQKTDTSFSPWIVVEAEDKKYGRVKVIEHVNTVLEASLKKHGFLFT